MCNKGPIFKEAPAKLFFKKNGTFYVTTNPGHTTQTRYDRSVDSKSR